MPHLSSFILMGQSRKALSFLPPPLFLLIKRELTPTVLHEKTTIGFRCTEPNLNCGLLIIWNSPSFIPFHISLLAVFSKRHVFTDLMRLKKHAPFPLHFMLSAVTSVK